MFNFTKIPKMYSENNKTKTYFQQNLQDNFDNTISKGKFYEYIFIRK